MPCLPALPALPACSACSACLHADLYIQDPAKCEAEVQRKLTDRKNSKRGWVYVLGSDLTKAPYNYTEEEAQAIINQQTVKGRFIDDEFFKDKTHLRQYLVRDKSNTGFVAENIQEETLTGTATMECDSAMLQALAGPDGLMQPGGIPDLPGLDHAAMASFAVENFEGTQACGKTKGGKGKKAIDPADPNAVAMPESPLQHAKAVEQEFLREAADANNFGIQISANALSSEMSEFMKDHAKKMTKFYHKLHKLVADGCDDMNIYEEKVFSDTRPMQELFRKKSDTAKALVRQIKKGAKKMAAAQASQPHMFSTFLCPRTL